MKFKSVRHGPRQTVRLEVEIGDVQIEKWQYAAIPSNSAEQSD